MGNCKRCGALIGADYMFCGKCGAPVYESEKEGKVIKVKKLKKLKKFERKLSSSAGLNLAMAGIWAVVSLAWAFFFFGGCTDIRIAAVGIGDTIGQLMSKYEYVKEGLSLSYISTEFAQVADYIFIWVLTVFSALMAVAGAILMTTYVINFTAVKKGKKYPAVMKLRSLVSKSALIIILLFVLIFIVTVILKGVI